MGLSGIADANGVNENVFGVNGKTIVTYVDCLLGYAQNNKLNNLGLGRVSLVQPYNAMAILVNRQLVIGFTNEKALYSLREFSVLNYQVPNAEMAEEVINTSSFLTRGYRMQFFINVSLDCISRHYNELINILNVDDNTKIDLFADLIETDVNIKDNVLTMTEKIYNYFSGVLNIMQINPVFHARNLTVDQTQVFYVLEFNNKRTGIFDVVKDCLEKKFDLNVIKSGSIINPEQADIMENIWISINTARFVIVDISDKNPNVFYELGICHAIGKPTLILCDKQSLQDDYHGKLPFDINTIGTVFYDNEISGTAELTRQVQAHAEAFIEGKVVKL